MIDPHLGIAIKIGTITMTIETGKGLAGPDPIHTVIATGVPVKVPAKGVILGLITDPHTTAHHAIEAQVTTTTDETPLTADPCYAEVFLGIAVDPDHVHHTNTTTRHQQDCYSSNQTAWRTKDRKHKQVTINDPPSEYYSSDEQASKSDNDLN